MAERAAQDVSQSLVRRVEQRGGARRGELGTGFLEFLASLQGSGGGRRRARAGRRRERGVFRGFTQSPGFLLRRRLLGLLPVRPVSRAPHGLRLAGLRRLFPPADGFVPRLRATAVPVACARALLHAALHAVALPRLLHVQLHEVPLGRLGSRAFLRGRGDAIGRLVARRAPVGSLRRFRSPAGRLFFAFLRLSGGGGDSRVTRLGAFTSGRGTRSFGRRRGFPRSRFPRRGGSLLGGAPSFPLARVRRRDGEIVILALDVIRVVLAAVVSAPRYVASKSTDHLCLGVLTVAGSSRHGVAALRRRRRRARLRGVVILLLRLHRRKHLVFVGLDVPSSPTRSRSTSLLGSRRTENRIRLGFPRSRRFSRRGGGARLRRLRGSGASAPPLGVLRQEVGERHRGCLVSDIQHAVIQNPARVAQERLERVGSLRLGQARETAGAAGAFLEPVTAEPTREPPERVRRLRSGRALLRDARGKRRGVGGGGEGFRVREQRAERFRGSPRRPSRLREGSRVGHRGLRRGLRRTHGLDARGRLHGCRVHHVFLVVAAVCGDGEARCHGDAGGRRGGLAREIPARGRNASPSVDERSTAGLRRARIGFRRARACVSHVLLLELRLERAIQPVHLLHPGRSSRVVLVRLSSVRAVEIRLPRLEVATRLGHPRDEIAVARSRLAQPRARARNRDIPAARLHRGRLSPRLTL